MTPSISQTQFCVTLQVSLNQTELRGYSLRMLPSFGISWTCFYYITHYEELPNSVGVIISNAIS